MREDAGKVDDRGWAWGRSGALVADGLGIGRDDSKEEDKELSEVKGWEGKGWEGEDDVAETSETAVEEREAAYVVGDDTFAEV